MTNWKDSIKKQEDRRHERKFSEEWIKASRKDWGAPRNRKRIINDFFEDDEIQELQLLHKVFNLLQDNEGYRSSPLGEFLTKMQTDAINRIEKVENPKIIKRAKEVEPHRLKACLLYTSPSPRD